MNEGNLMMKIVKGLAAGIGIGAGLSEGTPAQAQFPSQAIAWEEARRQTQSPRSQVESSPIAARQPIEVDWAALTIGLGLVGGAVAAGIAIERAGDPKKA